MRYVHTSLYIPLGPTTIWHLGQLRRLTQLRQPYANWVPKNPKTKIKLVNYDANEQFDEFAMSKRSKFVEHRSRPKKN